MPKMVNYNGGTFGMGTEWLHDFLFDRFRLLNTNPLETALFRSMPGATRNGVVLTIADTNNKGDRVPTKQKWYLWALEITYQGEEIRSDAEIQLIFNFFRTTILQFKIENLDTMFSIPLSAMRPTLQLLGPSAATFNGTYVYSANVDQVKPFKVPQVLEENAVWHLDIIQTAATAAGLDNDFLLFTFEREMFRQGG